MRHRVRSFASGIAGLLLAVTVSAHAAPGPSAADIAAIKNFKLTTDFLHKWEAYEEDAAKHPCELSPIIAMKPVDGKPRTLDQIVAAFDAQPGVHAALAKEGLTAHEALVGMFTLMGATMQEMTERYPGMMKARHMGQAPMVSAENMAFYRKHEDELHRHQMKIGREEFKLNHGKFPACLGGQK